MLVKIMSNEDAPDDDNRKLFTLVDDVVEITFHRPEDRAPEADMLRRGVNSFWQTYVIGGNVYVMNDQGKTIQTFGVSELPPPQPQAPSRH